MEIVLLTSLFEIINRFKNQREPEIIIVVDKLLTGFDDPEYRSTGATMFKIKDVTKFHTVLDEARQDQPKYIFEATPR